MVKIESVSKIVTFCLKILVKSGLPSLNDFFGFWGDLTTPKFPFEID